MMDFFLSLPEDLNDVLFGTTEQITSYNEYDEPRLNDNLSFNQACNILQERINQIKLDPIRKINTRIFEFSKFENFPISSILTKFMKSDLNNSPCYIKLLKDLRNVYGVNHDSFDRYTEPYDTIELLKHQVLFLNKHCPWERSVGK